MDKIAFISENAYIYWTPILLTISGLAAALIYLSVYIGKGGKFTEALISIPLSAALGIFIGRIFHWYCRSGSYVSFYAAITDYSNGDFALVGMFFGCMIVAALLRLVRLSDSLGKMLDAMSIGGCIGISVGRLASLFNDSSRGMLLPDYIGFPVSYPLVNSVTGESENRLATFMFQSSSAALIAVCLLLFMLVQYIRKRKAKDGDIFFLFLGAYSITQIVCDSTRYDALVFRSNGFVSMVQILGLVALLFITVIFSVRLVKARGFRGWYIALWVGILGMLGLAGYMEYFVQNNGTKALFAYSIMTAALVVLYIILLVIRIISSTKSKSASAEPISV